MNTNMLAVASSLSDHDLLDHIAALAGREREASVELVAHLAALDARPSLYAARGFGSLFNYCTEALRLSEEAACNRIIAARACRRFPVILESLASGAMSLTSVRLLHQHLTPQNNRDVLARAGGRSRREIEARAPRSGRPRIRGRPHLSVPGRMGRSHRAMSRDATSARPGVATVASARSSRAMATAAPSARSWSSITSVPMRSADDPRPRASRSGAGATINMKERSSLGREGLPRTIASVSE
jgi:hypothetical protein